MAGAKQSSLTLRAEFQRLPGIGQVRILLLDVDIVLDADDGAQLGLDGDILRPGHLDDLPGQGQVLLERLGRSVDHHRGPARLDAIPDEVQVLAVVQVQCDRHFRRARPIR